MSNSVFTIIQDEPVFLPVWLRHYSKFFDSNDIHVINHESSPANFSQIIELQKKYNFILENVYNEFSFDHKWLCKVVAEHQHELLNSYDCVLFCEADEIVTPKNGTIIEYMDNMTKNYMSTTGWEIIQKENEAKWNPDLPLIGNQRTYWVNNPQFSKPLISKEPLGWVPGFHWASLNAKTIFGDVTLRVKAPRDEELLLIHLHRVDFDYAFKKAQINSKKKWTKKDIKNQFGAQNRISELEKMKSWYYRDIDSWEKIPKDIYGLV